MRSPSSLVVSHILVFASLSFAQQSITGTVADPTGAVIVGARVDVTHVETGTVVSGASTSTGNYTIPNLAIGRHSVAIESPGFKRFVRENLQLDAAQTLRIDAKLEVGGQTDSVTVVATNSMLVTDSSAITFNITLDDLRNLPFFDITTGAVPLRDPYAVAQMLPGVQYNRTYNVMLVNGLPAEQVQYRIDGQVTGLIRGGTGFIGFQTLTALTQPSPDAVEQIAITTTNYTAEFGSVGGAMFNVTMKSGANQYHGSVYDYVANEAVNARDPVTHVRNKTRRNNWGITIGGPITIPTVYDGINKSFFFFSWDQLVLTTRVQSGAGNSRTVPNAAYRAGDFSNLFAASGGSNVTVGSGATIRDYVDVLGNTIRRGQLFDPASTHSVICNKTLTPTADCADGQPIPFRDPLLGNHLMNAHLLSPTSGKAYTGMDPVALAAVGYVPPPTDTSALVNNYFKPFSNDQSMRAPSLKLDHNVTQGSRISLTMQQTYQNQEQFLPDGFDAPITTSIGNKDNAPQLRFNYDQTLTPTMQLHVGAGWTMFELDRRPAFSFDPASGLGLDGTIGHRFFPRLDANTQETPQWGGLSALGTDGNFGFVSLSYERRPSGNVSLTWIKSSHTVKTGVDWRMDMLPTADPGYSDGHFQGFGSNTGITGQPMFGSDGVSETNNFTGFAYANLLLGGARGFEMRSPIAYRTSKQQWGLYLQDTWRASSRLTVELGLRWDYGTYTKEDYGRNGGLSLSTPNPLFSGRLGATVFEATCKCQLAQNYPYGIGPHLGLAYTITPKTVIRAGFSLAYGSTGDFGGFTTNSSPITAVPPYQASFLLREDIPPSLTPAPWPTFSPTLGHSTTGLTDIAFGTLGVLDPNAGRPARTFQWNISLQREITKNLVVQASYVANRGVWQSAPDMTDLNAVSQETLSHYKFQIGNLEHYRLLQAPTLSGLSAQDAATLQNTHGVVRPYPQFPASAGGVMQSIRPYPQYGGFFGSAIKPQRAPLGKSWYDALQLTLNHRYAHGLMVTGSYTYSKNLTTTFLPDVFNPNYGNKDLAQFNIPHQLRITFQYQTPRPASYLPVLGNRYVAYALEGWGIAMSLRYQSGFPLGRPNSGALRPITNYLGRSAPFGSLLIGAQLKKDANGNYVNPYSKDWVDYDGKHHTDPLDINCGCYDPVRTVLLDPNAWEAAPSDAWPAQTQRIPGYNLPRFPDESGNISRTFRFGRDGRYNFNVRAEFQNVFNRLLLPLAIQLGEFSTKPVPDANGLVTSGFGVFGNPNNANFYQPERRGTFVGRLTF